MTKSRSRRIVLLLDCCFGGAFARGMVHRAGESVAIKEEFDGQGRVVLTASRAMEYAFEGDTLEGEARPRSSPRRSWKGSKAGRPTATATAGSPSTSCTTTYTTASAKRRRTRHRASGRSTSTATSTSRAARSTSPSSCRSSYVRRWNPRSRTWVRARSRSWPAARRLACGFAAAAQLALETLAEDDSKRVSDAAARALGLESPRPSASRRSRRRLSEPWRRSRPARSSRRCRRRAADHGPRAVSRPRSTGGTPAGHVRAGRRSVARARLLSGRGLGTALEFAVDFDGDIWTI